MTSDSVLERIDAIKENDLPFEYIWMDAGWYGIDKERNYKFTDFDGGEFIKSGFELVDEGFKISIAEKRKAKIYLYQKV